MSTATAPLALHHAIESYYRNVAAGPMAGMALCNPRLGVRLARLEDWDGYRVGGLVMPWAINLLLLPASAPWPQDAPLAKRRWAFPSGEYDFVCAEDVGFGPFYTCSLFSPALEFESMDTACETATLAVLALLRAPLGEMAPAAAAQAKPIGRRRWLLGRGAR